MVQLIPGSLISDDYKVGVRLDHLADASGLEAVFEGRRCADGQPVLLRVFGDVDDPTQARDLKARFVHAARSASRFDHPAFVRVLDFGLSGDGRPFMVQEHLGGYTLSEGLLREGPLEPARALALLSGCVEGLALVQARGMVYRNLEPRTLMWTDPGGAGERLRLFSFSSMYLDDGAAERMTQSGDLIGTARYLAPEYIEHGEVSAKLDVYQAGLVLIELLTGEPAVGARDPVGCVMAHTRGLLQIPQWIKDGPLWSVIQQAVARDPALRYPNAKALSEALSVVSVAFEVSKSELDEEGSVDSSSSVGAHRRLGGHFEILDEIGEGGFAKVYRGRHRRTHQPVAIKVMTRRPDNEMHESFKKRFLREAQSAARVSHPNIVGVYHYGMADDLPYIVLEMLEGHDLEEELARNGSMAPERLLPLFIEALDALGEAHRCKVVHKDLKPANLFLSCPKKRWETIKILDFGIARMGEGEESRLTQNGRMLFTCHYVAPEYVEFQIAAPQTDVYQMGLILAELLTGRLVVDGEQFECIMLHMKGKLDLDPRLLDSPLGPVLQRALAREHTARYADGTAFAAALRQIDPGSLGLTPTPAAAPADSVHSTPGGMDDTVQTDVADLGILQYFKRIEHLHAHEPGAIDELHALIAACLERGHWGATSWEMAFIEEVLSGIEQRLALRPSPEALERNRRLIVEAWNKRRQR